MKTKTMEKELDPEVIKLTQLTLGKYVKRPPLSEKLLKKPPFRFLHDIITTVLKTTGFFDKLFDEEELISDNVKDRDSKISFLNKVIFVISATTGKSLAVKPSKIVAGQEPEKTNELLQCLAKALDDKLSSNQAVKQYKDSLKSNQTTEPKTKEPTKPVKKTNDAKKITSKTSEKLPNQSNDVTRPKQDKEKTNELKSKRKENASNKSEVQSQRSQQSKTVPKKNAREQKESKKDDNSQSRTNKTISNVTENNKTDIVEKESNLSNTLSKVHSQDLDISLEKEDLKDDELNVNEVDASSINQDNQDKLNTSYTIVDSDLNTSASSNDLLETPQNQNQTTEIQSLENNSTREISANKNHQINNDHNDTIPLKIIEPDINIPDKLHDTPSAREPVLSKEPENKIIDVDKYSSLNAVKAPVNSGNDIKIPRPPSVRPASVRPSSSRPGAPRMREKVDNVVKDTDNLLMGKVNIIVENTHNEEEEDNSLVLIDQSATNEASHDQQELQLSSNEHGHLVQQILDSQKELSQISGKTEIEWQFGAQKAREALNQDVEQLRFNIQALSRVANPLGKLLDHIQEDVEVMRQELQQWTNIYENVNKEMLKQKTLNEDALMPYHAKLKQLDADIEEKRDKINDLKILIHKNSNRIEKLLP